MTDSWLARQRALFFSHGAGQFARCGLIDANGLLREHHYHWGLIELKSGSEPQVEVEA